MNNLPLQGVRGAQMTQPSKFLRSKFRPATDQDVRSWSFGVLKSPRNADTTGWEQQLGTLDDQGIFGPKRDFECVCGKYCGIRYQNMICDHCGVKVTTHLVRRQRFGHIELHESVAHPLGYFDAQLRVFPVMPAVFVQSQCGERLGRLYDDLIRSVQHQLIERTKAVLKEIVDLLLPLLVLAHDWHLSDTEVIAHGLALIRCEEQADEVCQHCGYPFRGKVERFCPGCGRLLC